jgi:hypothetical protein
MEDAEKLAMLRNMVGDNDADSVLSTYLTIAGQKIINRAYPYDTTVTVVPTRYETLQCEIAAYLMNKRGAEGQTGHTENGINRQYENADVPASMLKPVTPYCGVIK